MHTVTFPQQRHFFLVRRLAWQTVAQLHCRRSVLEQAFCQQLLGRAAFPHFVLEPLRSQASRQIAVGILFTDHDAPSPSSSGSSNSKTHLSRSSSLLSHVPACRISSFLYPSPPKKRCRNRTGRNSLMKVLGTDSSSVSTVESYITKPQKILNFHTSDLHVSIPESPSRQFLIVSAEDLVLSSPHNPPDSTNWDLAFDHHVCVCALRDSSHLHHSKCQLSFKSSQFLPCASSFLHLREFSFTHVDLRWRSTRSAPDSCSVLSVPL